MRNVYSLQPRLDNPGKYPQSEWARRQSKYWQYFYHFDGDIFDEQSGGNDSYPLKLNVYKIAAMMHAGFLFGEVSDSSDPLVRIVVEPWGQGSNKERIEKTQRMTDLVNLVWYENDGRELQQNNGIISQVAGGCVFNVAYDSSREDEGLVPIRLGTTMPYYFFPVWSSNNYRNLLEALVTFQISALQATEFGVSGANESVSEVQYQEHWMKTKYEITVNGDVINWNGIKMSGAPLCGIVPYTYIPHIRTGDFYGESLFEGKDNLAKEVNARWADMGDIVADNARQMPAIWNSPRPVIRRLRSTLPVIDLGEQTPGIGEPPGIQFPTGSTTSPATVQHASNLLSIARTQAYTPDIVYGIDEGSQRSYLTLATRMIPLIVHIRHERTLWTVGLDRITRQILKIAAEKGIEGITFEDLKRIRIHADWAPMLPRDQQAELNEIILRFNNNLITMEQALNKLGDVPDVKTAMNVIKEWMEEKSELENAGMQNAFGQSGSNGEQAGFQKPAQPTANIKKEE